MTPLMLRIPRARLPLLVHHCFLVGQLVVLCLLHPFADPFFTSSLHDAAPGIIVLRFFAMDRKFWYMDAPLEVSRSLSMERASSPVRSTTPSDSSSTRLIRGRLPCLANSRGVAWPDDSSVVPSTWLGILGHVVVLGLEELGILFVVLFGHAGNELAKCWVLLRLLALSAMDVPGVALGHKVQHLIFWNGLAQQFGVGVEAVFAVALVTPATAINQATSIATAFSRLGSANRGSLPASVGTASHPSQFMLSLLIAKPSTMTVVFLSTRRSARESSGAAAAVLLTVFCLLRFAVHMRINGFVLALLDDRFEIPGNHFAHINFRMTQSSSAATDQALQLVVLLGSPLSLLRLVGRMDVLHGLGYLCREVQLLSNPAHHLLFHSTRAQQLVDSNRFGLLHRGRSQMSMTLYSEDVSLKSLICRLRTARWVLPSKRTWRNVVKRGGEAREDEDLLSLFHDELVDDLVQHDKFTRGMHDVISVVVWVR
ncbi:hypothetical protein KCU93_g182, partial [Aureobasidium melanogenum]